MTLNNNENLLIARVELQSSADFYLILLGEAQAVVGLESLDVVGEVDDGDGRVLPHSWKGRGRKGRREAER